MSAVAGLRTALREYESDKVRERQAGAERIREIFGNRENLFAFQETGGSQGGQGWIALFQCLYACVKLEKRAAKKSNATATADKRLAEAISLVRWMAERSVYFIARKPVIALVTHMTALLVDDTTLFEPAVGDYAKALRTILSYPPHLESIDGTLWKRLMTVCWAGILGDRIPREDQWIGDVEEDELDEESEDVNMGQRATDSSHARPRGKGGISQTQVELLQLVPILLASPSAPILPVFPTRESPHVPPTSVGYSLLMKAIRFLEQHPTETTAHLHALRSINAIVSELELNSRHELVSAGAKLLPRLQDHWLAKSKPLREQVVISMRTLLPFLAHYSVGANVKAVLADCLAKMVDSFGKESSLRWGLTPLDLQVLRLSGHLPHSTSSPTDNGPPVFDLQGVQPGFDFTHEHVLQWSIIGTYAICYATAASLHSSVPQQVTPEDRVAKRRKVQSPISILLDATSTLNISTVRCAAVQTVAFIVGQRHLLLSAQQRSQLLARLSELIDAEDDQIQSWALIALAIASRSIGLASIAPRVWTSAVRKITSAAVSRAASFCVLSMIETESVSADRISTDIGAFLRMIDIQGPSYPVDSIALLVAKCLSIARSDVRLYSLNLEEKVIAWLTRYNTFDGTRGKSRQDAHTSSDLVALVASAAGLSPPPSRVFNASLYLPECPIVNRVLEEHRTSGIRSFVLDGTLPPSATARSSPASMTADPAAQIGQLPPFATPTGLPSTQANGEFFEAAILNERQKRLASWLGGQLQGEVKDLATGTSANARPPERIRKLLDLAIVSIAYLALLRANGTGGDRDLVEAVRNAIIAFQPDLINTASSLGSQHRLWSAFEPLLPDSDTTDMDWPILLKAGESSGMRPDVVPRVNRSLESDTRCIKAWCQSLWSIPELSDSMKILVQSARQVLDTAVQAPISPYNHTQAPQAPMATQLPSTMIHDNDDFGEIRNVETDVMPTSKEAFESHRISTSVTHFQISLRLFGTAAQSGRANVKDTQLLNGLLDLDGTKFMQVAESVCHAIHQGQLRITVQAIEALLGKLEEMTATYAYSRDEHMFVLLLFFLRCSAPIWLSPEVANGETAERAMNIALWAVQKVPHLQSWKAGLAALVFIDEYLDYEPDSKLWDGMKEEGKDEAGNDKFSVPAVVAGSLSHPDIRVRIRGATSTAALWYLPTLVPSNHLSFYLRVMDQQPRMPTYWDAFLTDMLWKLNCVVASYSPRAAVVYHLLEVPFTTGTFDLHLQRGLEAVSNRLGFGSTARLFGSYSSIIVTLMLAAEQTPLGLSASLCGYGSAQAQASSQLDDLGAILLGDDRLTYFNTLCEETGRAASSFSVRVVYPVAARLLCKAAGYHDGNAVRITADLSDGLWSLPFASKFKSKDITTTHGAALTVELLQLVSAKFTATSSAQEIGKIDKADPNVFLHIANHLPATDQAHPDLILAQWTEKAYFDAMAYLIHACPKMHRPSVAFNAIIQLFANLNNAILVAERVRILDCLAVTLGCFPDTLANEMVLGILMQELIAVLDQVDIGDIALHVLELAFARLAACTETVLRLDYCMLRLGRMRPDLSPYMQSRIDNVIRTNAPNWKQIDQIWHTVEHCSIVWPIEMHRQLGGTDVVTYDNVVELSRNASPADAMKLCQRLAETHARSRTGATAILYESDRRFFAEDLFWHIKQTFEEKHWNAEGAEAFLDLLSACDGQVDIVCSSIESTERTLDRLSAHNLRHEHGLLVQVLITRRLIKLTDSDDSATRYTAYQTLRRLRTLLDPMVPRKLIPDTLVGEIPLLLSPEPTEVEFQPSATLASLQKEDIGGLADRPEEWLRTLCSRLCDVASVESPFYGRLTTVLTVSMVSLSPLLPLLIQAILGSSPDATILEERQTAIQSILDQSLRNPAADHKVLDAVVNVMLSLRLFSPPFRQKQALGSLLWLKFDFVLLAEVAAKTGSFATSLMCLEIAKTDIPDSNVDLYDHKVQAILLEVYSNVDDPDGFYGIKTHNIRDSLRRRLDHEGQYLRAFGLHGADLEARGSMSESGGDLVASARNLHSYGLHRTAQTIARTVQNEDQRVDSNSLFFDIAWRTGDWDLPVSTAAMSSAAGSFYSALRAMHRERDQAASMSVIRTAVKSEMIRLRDLGSERMSEIHKSINDLLCLREVARWFSPSFNKALSEGDIKSMELRSFVDIEPSLRYSLAERQHASRMSVLTSAKNRESQNLMGDLSTPLQDLLQSLEIRSRLSFSSFARAEGVQQAAVNAITAVQHIQGTNETSEAMDEFGAVLWMQGEHALALQHVDEMIASLKASAGDKNDQQLQGRLGVLLGRQAHWSHLSKQLTGGDVAEKFDNAQKMLLRNRMSEEELALLSFHFACFAAEQQETLRTNGELDTLRGYQARKEAALASLDEPNGSNNRRESKSLKESRLERAQSLEREKDKVDRHETQIDVFTKHALRMFAQAFRLSDKYDDSITRMCSIWLAHADSKNAVTVNEANRAQGIAKAFASSIESIPSHKFIFLGPQLAARLYRSGRQTNFNLQLNGLLLRLSKDHPYHILYQIIPLASGINVPSGAASSTSAARGRKSAAATPDFEGRGPAAAELLHLLEADQVHTMARTASKHMKIYAEAATPWCLHPPPKETSKSMNIPTQTPIVRLPHDLQIPIPTVIPPVRPNSDYSNVPRLKRYSTAYSVLGGLHRPKKMKCYDTNGSQYYQLFKGDDEIRQDAIMEQVFGMTNTILQRDRQTKARKLKFRTYVVIPLAQKTGILEFVGEGTSIGDWLKPAHERYRKQGDLSSSTIRDTIRALQDREWNDPKIVTRWQELIPRFPPVMRHLFREKQTEPMGWFAMRLNYVRSVAVTSIVGHILGIGDRHLSNIMIDTSNGEVIHIDFGIVFEEGANLRIPERVPFRLTADLMDGLGIMGVDGTFRRCSEQTLRVLRASSPLVLTVLEVFKHDPLFAWMGDPDKLQRAQGGGRIASESHTAAAMDKADRVLGKIRAKLKDELGVEYTVNQLVLQATDPENLAKIYHGWHSWF